MLTESARESVVKLAGDPGKPQLFAPGPVCDFVMDFNWSKTAGVKFKRTSEFTGCKDNITNLLTLVICLDSVRYYFA